MDATLFDPNYRQTRASCYPSTTDAFSWGLATLYANGQLRAAGLYGSVGFIPGAWEVDGCTGLQTNMTIELPLGYFGTVRPPMIFLAAQFGSRILYKCMRDTQQHFTKPARWPNPDGGVKENLPPEYQVFIDNLHADATVTPSGTQFQWKFIASLHCIHTERDYIPTTYGMQFQSYPLIDGYTWWIRGLLPVATNPQKTIRGVMHWYAVGVDAW